MNQYPEQGSGTVRSRLHCPHCRSEQLIVVSEAGETTGVATHGRMTRNTGMTTYNTRTVNRHYWMCKECGHKFRNLEDLNNELVKETKNEKVLKIVAIVFGLLTLLIVIPIVSNLTLLLIFSVPLLLLIGLDLVFYLAWRSTKKKVESMTLDKAYLEQHCFD